MASAFGPSGVALPFADACCVAWPPCRPKRKPERLYVCLPKCTLSITLVLTSGDHGAGAAKVYFLTTLVLKSCDFCAGAAKVRFLYYTCAEKL